MTRKKLGCIVCALLLVTLLARCGGDNVEDRSDTTQIQGVAAETDGSAATEVDDVADGALSVDTSYGTLYYPEQWGEYLLTEESWDAETLQVSFSAQINGTVYPMFQVVVGDSDEVEVGTLTDESGTQRKVYMKVTELEEEDALTDTEQNRLYAMQEDLNYVIDHLK